MQTAQRVFFFLLASLFLANLFLANVFFANPDGSWLVTTAFAEGTRTWEQSKYDELIKGTATGVAIRNTGGLELAPALKALYSTPSTYVWSMTTDDGGNVYLATGAPARVYRITPEGKASIIFEPKELQVQTLQSGPGGAIYAATAPDGKVYKLERKSASKALTPNGNAAPSPLADKNADKNKDKNKVKEKEKDAERNSATPSLDPEWSSSVYFEPGTKYIWDLALDKAGTLYVATGDHGEIYRVTPKGEHSVFFKSDETHIRVLAFDAQENLIAGSDGNGLIYRISPSGEGLVLYSAPKKEITALALDRSGNIYAAAVGEKRGGLNLPAAPVLIPVPANPAGGGNVPLVPGMSITTTPGNPAVASPFPFPGGSAGGGSDIYRIAPDGSPTKLWTSHDDIVYSLMFDSHSRLLAGTGNRGHVYAITGPDDFSDLLKVPASQVTALSPAPGGGLYLSTSNLGKAFVLGPSPDPEGKYESDVFDAKNFSRWGRMEFRGAGNVELFARSGNVDNPDRNWSPWQKIDVARSEDVTKGERAIPSARYAQWKAVLHAGSVPPRVDSVILNYLPKNAAPEIDDVAIQLGVRYQQLPKPQAMGSDSGGPFAGAPSAPHFEMPPPSLRDRDSIGVKWSAHDENDDQLVFSVYYRGDGQTRWLLLKDNLQERAYSFDASLLPDGGYTLKIVASDAPSHSPGEALTVSRESRRFEVDTTPPRIDNLTASADSGQIHVTFQASDSFSPIRRAEYSMEAGEWKYIEPLGQISDTRTERYDFRIVPEAGKDEKDMEHVVVVRAYDRYENMGAAKVVVRSR